MKPLSLQGHERALTRVRINREGDLLFTASKDHNPCVWYMENGERIGTYTGHTGVIWDLDVSWDSRRLVTSSGDPSVKVWDVETGKVIGDITVPVVSRSNALSYSGNLVAYTVRNMVKTKATLFISDIRDPDQLNGELKAGEIIMENSATSCVFSHLDNEVIVGNEKGGLEKCDLRNLTDFVDFSKPHNQSIQDLQMSHDQCFVISSSSDKTAKLHDAHTLEILKTYSHTRPVNSAAVSPTHEFIALGGGEEARDVTQTASSSGQFETKLFNMLSEKEFAQFKGHFGPVNTLAYSPDGRTIVTGSEDGFIRIQEMDQKYFEYEPEY